MSNKKILAAALIWFAASMAYAAEAIRIGMIEGMSGTFANAGEAVARNLQFAIANVNARGGVKLADGRYPLALEIFDNKQGVEESLIEFKRLTDKHIAFMVQGNSSAIASALLDAVDKHNQRVPDNRVLFLNYSAVDPILTNEKCSYWHFRFDANADMRMHALTEVIKGDARAQRVYLIGQDYSFGRMVAQTARSQLSAKRPDIVIVGDELHPIGKIKDFAPYIAKIKASAADTVITGNWGNDLTLLVKAAKEFGLNAKFYTFYGNSLGAPAAIEKAGSTESAAVAKALEGARYQNAFHDASMRAADHQLIQPLYVSVMRKKDKEGVRFDIEGSGYGFKTERYLSAASTTLPTSCHMQRPAR